MTVLELIQDVAKQEGIIMASAVDVRESTRELACKAPDNCARSVLFDKYYDNLAHFSWEPIVREFFRKEPALARLCCIVGAPHAVLTLGEAQKLMPKLGIVYAILIQNRQPEASLVQRLISVIFLDSHVKQRVSNIAQ